MIQQNYLQQDFDRITAPTTQEELEKEQEKLAQRGQYFEVENGK